ARDLADGDDPVGELPDRDGAGGLLSDRDHPERGLPDGEDGEGARVAGVERHHGVAAAERRAAEKGETSRLEGSSTTVCATSSAVIGARRMPLRWWPVASESPRVVVGPM